MTFVSFLIGSQIVIVLLLIIALLNKKDRKYTELMIHLSTFEKSIDKLSDSLNSELSKYRDEFNKNAREQREESQRTFTLFQDSLTSKVTDNLNHIRKQLSEDAKTNRNELGESLNSFEQRLDRLRQAVDERLKSLQTENAKKLDEMRIIVDEKLQATLEKRLGDSFKQVSERLEKVHQGLGDMKNLAAGVGDLKKVLTNVKNRGMLGEYQLANLLEQILNPEQFEANVKCSDDNINRVEFAIKLPGRDDTQKQVYLPIDAKFPIEDYYKLQDAYESGEISLIESARKAITVRIKNSAKDIRDKYINPPITTDFAIMFLPAEGLYAEVINRVGLFEQIQKEFKVVISGPTTLGALLNSLQMGFRTFAIQKRSGQVWKLLGEVKSEFGKFGTILQKTQKDIINAGSKLDELIGTRTRAIERKLRDVEELPATSETFEQPDRDVDN